MRRFIGLWPSWRGHPRKLGVLLGSVDVGFCDRGFRFLHERILSRLIGKYIGPFDWLHSSRVHRQYIGPLDWLRSKRVHRQHVGVRSKRVHRQHVGLHSKRVHRQHVGLHSKRVYRD